jgi:hypothetical protein
MIGWNSNLGDAMIKSGNVAPVGVGRKEMISTFPDLVPAIDQYNRERYTYMSSELTLGDDFDMGEGSDFNKLEIDDDFNGCNLQFPRIGGHWRSFLWCCPRKQEQQYCQVPYTGSWTR